MNCSLIINEIFSNNFWTKWSPRLYVLYAAILFGCITYYLIRNIYSSPKKKIDFVNSALKRGDVVTAKLSCLTLHGRNQPEYYEAEYMYVLDNKTNFITYRIAVKYMPGKEKDDMNADIILTSISPYLLLFYDKENPKKIMSKIEIFTSSYGIHKIPTPKKNNYRNVDSEWAQPIDLISYV